MKYRNWAYIASFMICLPGIAQTDAVREMNDSLDIVKAEEVVQIIYKADSAALSDSINQLVIEKELESLRANERSKRQKLEQQLRKLQRSDSIRQAQMYKEIGRLKADAIGFPVIARKDTLFTVYTETGSVTPVE